MRATQLPTYSRILGRKNSATKTPNKKFSASSSKKWPARTTGGINSFGTNSGVASPILRIKPTNTMRSKTVVRPRLTIARYPSPVHINPRTI